MIDKTICQQELQELMSDDMYDMLSDIKISIQPFMLQEMKHDEQIQIDCLRERDIEIQHTICDGEVV